MSKQFLNVEAIQRKQ